MVHDPATLASPDLLSDVSDMKQDLIKISGFLSNEVSESSLVDGLKYCIDKEDEEEEPFDIVEKVKEDLEKVGMILNVGDIGKDTENSKFSDKLAAEEKIEVIEPVLREVRVTRATDCRSAPQKDASELVSHLSKDLESYLQDLPVIAQSVHEQNTIEETFTEVVLPRKRHPPRIKKPARKKLKDRDAVSCSSEDELERMSSEESLDGDTLLGDTEIGVPPVSPKVVETPIGSIKDRVKALQKKVEEEEKEESVKVREGRRVTAAQRKDFLTMRDEEEHHTPSPKSPKSPRSQTERIEHSMSVKELMKAFQTGQDPSKSKSGLFEHKVITTVVVTSATEVSKETTNAQISALPSSKIKPLAEEIWSQRITEESSQIIHEQSIHEQAIRTSEDPSVSRLHSESMLISVREEPCKTSNEHRIQHGEQGEASDMTHKKEMFFSEENECSKGLDEDEIQAKDSRVTLKVWHEEHEEHEEQKSPTILHTQSSSHERRTSEEPQISPDRRPSEDFSAVIKEELEESPEYQLFIQAAGSSPVSYKSYRETRIIQDADQVKHSAVEHHSYKLKPAVRFAPSVVRSEKFISTIIHDEERNEKLNWNVQAGEESTEVTYRSRAPRTSLEDETYDKLKQTREISPGKIILSEQNVKTLTETEDAPEEESAIQLAYTESESPTKSPVQTEEAKENVQQDQDMVQGSFFHEDIKGPVHMELEFISPTDIESHVQTEKQISLKAESDQLNQDVSSNKISLIEAAVESLVESEDFQKSQQRLTAAHGLDDAKPGPQINSPEMIPDKGDLTSHMSPDLMQESSTEIKSAVQSELKETHLHETEKEFQHVYITTVETMTVTETQAQEVEMGSTVESDILDQSLDSYKVPVSEESKQNRGLYEGSPEVQEIQKMVDSTAYPAFTDDLQYVSGPELVCKSDSQEVTTPGKEEFSTHMSSDLVQVSSREIKSPVQSESRALHETEDQEHVYKTTVERESLFEIQTQIQTGEEIGVHVRDDSPVQGLDETYQTYAVIVSKQTTDLDNFTEETAESEEYQQSQQRLYSYEAPLSEDSKEIREIYEISSEVQEMQQIPHSTSFTSSPEVLDDLQYVKDYPEHQDSQEMTTPYDKHFSTHRSPDSVQVEERRALHETEEDQEHVYKTTVERVSLSEIQTDIQKQEEIGVYAEDDSPCQGLDETYQEDALIDAKQTRDLDISAEETAESEEYQQIQERLYNYEAPVPDESKQIIELHESSSEVQEIQEMLYSTSRPALADDHVTSDSELVCKSDPQEMMITGEEDLFTHSPPDSVLVSSKSPVQPERKALHETEEDQEHVYKTTVERVSLSEIQTDIQKQEEIGVYAEDDSPCQGLDETYQEDALIDAKQTRDLDISAEETAESEEYQQIQERLYNYEAPVPDESKQIIELHESSSEVQEIQEMLYSTSRPALADDHVTSDSELVCKSDPQEMMITGEEDLFTHSPPDSVLVSSKSPVQPERKALHETEEDQEHVYKTTVERVSLSEIQTDIQKQEEIGVYAEDDSPCQGLDETYQEDALIDAKQTRDLDISAEETAESEEYHQIQERLYNYEAPVPDESKQIIELHESSSEVQEIQEMLYSTSRPGLADDHVTSDSELVCKSDPQEMMITGEEDLFTHSPPDSVLVSSKSPVQPERKALHETEEDQEHVYKTTVERVSLSEIHTQIQTEEEIVIHVGDDSPYQGLDETYQEDALTDAKQTRDLDLSSEETAKSEEYQQIQERLYNYEAPVPEESKQIIELHESSPEVQEIQQMLYSTSRPGLADDHVTSDPELVCKSDPQEMAITGEEDFFTHSPPGSVLVSSKSPVQTERKALHETEEDQEHVYKTTVERVSLSEIHTQIQTEEEIGIHVGDDSPYQGLDETYQEDALTDAKQTRDLDLSSEETAKSEEYQQIQERLYNYKAPVPEESKQIVKLHESSSEVQEIQQMLYSTSRPALAGDHVTSDSELVCKSDPQEMAITGEEDFFTHSPPDSVLVSSREIKGPVQSKRKALHDTEEDQEHVYKTTVERVSLSEIHTQVQTEEEIGIHVGDDSPYQGLDETYQEDALTDAKQTRDLDLSSEETAKSEEYHQIQERLYNYEAPVPEESKQIIELYESSPEVQEIQQMLYSTSRPGLADDHVTSDPELVCKSDPQEMAITGEEYFFTHSPPGSVLVSSKSPVQTERKALHETEEDQEHVYKTTVERVSEIQTQIQTEEEMGSHVGDDSPYQGLDETYQEYTLTDAKQTRDLEISSEEPAESEEHQEIRQSLYNYEAPVPEESKQIIELHKSSSEVQEIQEMLYSTSRPALADEHVTSDPEIVCKSDPQEMMVTGEEFFSTHRPPDSVLVSPREIKSSVQSERKALHDTEEDQEHVYKTTVERVSLSEIHTQIQTEDEIGVVADASPVQRLDETYQTYAVIDSKQTTDLDNFTEETAESEEYQQSQKSLYSYEAPLSEDSKEIREIYEISSEVQEMQQIPHSTSFTSSPEVLDDLQYVKDYPEYVHKSDLQEITPGEDVMTKAMLIQSEDNFALSSETPDAEEPSVPFQQSQEENDEEDQEINEMKKLFTPEEKMFKMAAKIRVFDEIEKETKTRKVRFDFSTSSQDRDDEVRENEDLQSCDESPLDYEEEDRTQECGSTMWSSYPDSEYCDTSLTEVPQEELSESQTSALSSNHEYGASDIGELKMESLPMQIYIDKKLLSHEDFSPECLIKENNADTFVALPEDSAAMLVGNSDIEHHGVDEKTGEMLWPQCPVNDGKAMEEQPHPYGYEEVHGGKSQSISEEFQGDLVPWSVDVKDDEEHTSDTRSPQSTPEMPPARTENGQPNPFLFQEGKLFEMTRGGAIDMSRRSMEEDLDAFVFFPISENPAEDGACEQVSQSATEFSTSLQTSLDIKCVELPQDVFDPSDEARDSESHSDSESPKEEKEFDSSIADIDTATSTVTRSIYSEQDMESSDSSAEEDQHSVVEMPTPTQDDFMIPSGETLQISSHWSPSSPRGPVAEPESRKPKSRIPVKVTSFDNDLGKGESTEQNQRPKSETDICFSNLMSGIHSHPVKPTTPVSKIPVSVEHILSGTLHSGQTHEDGDEMSPDDKDSPQTVLDGDSRSKLFQTRSVGEDIFETRPNWEDCVETQMQRLSDSSSPDQSK
ncbi:ankyrin-2-like isoform X5, partial [Clarias magur]